MTEITFRFVIELSEDTRDFLWELVDAIQGQEDEEGETGSDSDSDLRTGVRDRSDNGDGDR